MNRTLLLLLSLFALSAEVISNELINIQDPNRSSYPQIRSEMNDMEVAENFIQILGRALTGHKITDAENAFLSYNDIIEENILIKDTPTIEYNISESIIEKIDAYFENIFQDGNIFDFGFQYIHEDDSYLNHRDSYLDYMSSAHNGQYNTVPDFNNFIDFKFAKEYGKDICNLIFSRGPIVNGYGNIYETDHSTKIINRLIDHIQTLINETKNRIKNIEEKGLNCKYATKGALYHEINSLIEKLVKICNESKIKTDLTLNLMQILNDYEKNDIIFNKNEQIIKNISFFFEDLSDTLNWFTTNLKWELINILEKKVTSLESLPSFSTYIVYEGKYYFLSF